MNHDVAAPSLLVFGGGPTDAVMVNNHDWLGSLGYIEMLQKVGTHFTVNRMLAFDSVKLRLEREQPMTFLEFNYMLMQSVDFLELNRRYGVGLQLGGHIVVLELHALRGFVPDDRFHLEQIDHALEVVFGTNGDHDRHGVGLQAQAHLVIDLEEVGTGTVHLVDERDTGNLVLVSLTPYGFRLRLHAFLTIEHCNSTVENTQRTLNLCGKVNVSWRIDNIKPMFWKLMCHTFPKGRNSG